MRAVEWVGQGACAWRRDAVMSGRAGGLISISIDLELDPRHPHCLHPRLDAVRQELIDLFSSLAIPATWAVADPLYSAATDSILAAGGAQEIAVLGDEAWLGPGCGRLRMARELARRFAAARQAGIPTTTLAIRSVSRMPELDLLWEHGVRTLCPPASSCRPGPAVQPRGWSSGRMWQSPVPWRFPLAGGWWSWNAWLVWRAIQKATSIHSALHLRLEASQLMGAPRKVLRWLGRLLLWLVRQRQGGCLSIRTLAEQASESLRASAAMSPAHPLATSAA